MRDAELENAIDEVGRDKVFAFALVNGWPPGSCPEKYVWWQIVRELRNIHTGQPHDQP